MAKRPVLLLSLLGSVLLVYSPGYCNGADSDVSAKAQRVSAASAAKAPKVSALGAVVNVGIWSTYMRPSMATTKGLSTYKVTAKFVDPANRSEASGMFEVGPGSIDSAME